VPLDSELEALATISLWNPARYEDPAAHPPSPIDSRHAVYRRAADAAPDAGRNGIKHGHRDAARRRRAAGPLRPGRRARWSFRWRKRATPRRRISRLPPPGPEQHPRAPADSLLRPRQPGTYQPRRARRRDGAHTHTPMRALIDRRRAPGARRVGDASWLSIRKSRSPAEALNGRGALELVARLVPDLLFLDIQMPGMTGFELLERLVRKCRRSLFHHRLRPVTPSSSSSKRARHLLKPIRSQPSAAPPYWPGCAAVPNARVSNRSSSATAIAAGSSGCRHLPTESEGNYTACTLAASAPLIRRSLNALKEQLDPQPLLPRWPQRDHQSEVMTKVGHRCQWRLTVTLRGGLTVDMSSRQSHAVARDT